MNKLDEIAYLLLEATTLAREEAIQRLVALCLEIVNNSPKHGVIQADGHRKDYLDEQELIVAINKLLED